MSAPRRRSNAAISRHAAISRNAAISRHAALLTAFTLVLMSGVVFFSAGKAGAEEPDDQSPPRGLARLVAAAEITRAETPDDQSQPNISAADGENSQSTQSEPTDSVVTAEIVNRPEGDTVVTITPNGNGITIKVADNEETQSQAPLWPDNPNKDDPEADPGSQEVGEAIADQQVLVVLNRPTTTRDDGEKHANQWDAWQTTYLELISKGNPFIECEIDHHVPEVEHCWVVDPALVPDPQQAAEADSEDGGRESTPSALPLSPEERWPGRNYQWTDPGPVEEQDSDQPTPVEEQDSDQPTPVEEQDSDQPTPVEEPDSDQPTPVEEQDSSEDTNPLTTTGQNPEDGSEITVVNIPSPTDDPEQRKRNFDLENETLDALDEAGEPYVVCFDDQTYVDMHTGDTVTIPAFCNVIDPSA